MKLFGCWDRLLGSAASVAHAADMGFCSTGCADTCTSRPLLPLAAESEVTGVLTSTLCAFNFILIAAVLPDEI